MTKSEAENDTQGSPGARGVYYLLSLEMEEVIFVSQSVPACHLLLIKLLQLCEYEVVLMTLCDNL